MEQQEKKSNFVLDTEKIEYTHEGENSRIEVRATWADVARGFQKLFGAKSENGQSHLKEVK